MSQTAHFRLGFLSAFFLLCAVVPGCHSASRRSVGRSPSVVTGDPVVISDPGQAEVALADAPPPTPDSAVVERHPLFRKPKQYYNSTKSNKVVKTAAATVVGVPAGIFGELKQIVVGVPSPSGSPAN